MTNNKKTNYMPFGIRLEDGVPAYTHADHLGSPVAGTDETGTVLWREIYAPYGDKLVNPAANRDNEGYTGHVDDASSGLTYMQARYYDPNIGRFLVNDPVGFVDSGFNPQMFNRYSYTWNDPVNLTDPDGRCPWCIGAAMGALAKAVEIKASGGKIFSRESAVQIAGAAAIGAVGGSAAAIVSNSIKGVAALAGATKAAANASKLTKTVNAAGSVIADTAGGAAGDTVASAVSQAFDDPGDRSGNAGLQSAAQKGAVLSSVSSVAGQVTESVTGQQFSPSAAAATGSRASKIIDATIAVGTAIKNGVQDTKNDKN